tara:strand:- start:36941 stop:37933 length:993 start_codon:yes stop_codon:yes gene_type:complete
MLFALSKGMKSFLILILCIFTNLSFGAELTSEQEVTIKKVIQDLIQSSHQSLNKENLKISLYTIDSPEYFFVSNFGAKRLLLGSKNYRIGVNPLIFKNNIPKDALKAVLAHELVHTEDYENGSTLGTILPIGVKVSFKKSRAQYERKTDLKVVKKGFYKELLSYKKWQYTLLSPAALKIKKIEYLTPEEIYFTHNIATQQPELFNTWTEDFTPRNLSEFKLSTALFNKDAKLILEKKDYKIKESKDRRYRNGPRNSYYYSMTFKNSSNQDCLLLVYPFSNGKIKWKRKKTYNATANSATLFGWKQFGKLKKVIVAPQNCPLAQSFYSYSH